MDHNPLGYPRKCGECIHAQKETGISEGKKLCGGDGQLVGLMEGCHLPDEILLKMALQPLAVLACRAEQRRMEGMVAAGMTHLPTVKPVLHPDPIDLSTGV